MISALIHVAAYLAAFFIVGGLAGVVASAAVLPAMAALPRLGKLWSVLSGLAGAVLAYMACLYFFQWLGVHYGWYSYLVCMYQIIYQDGQRVAFSQASPNLPIEKAHAQGTFLGILCSLAFHFLA